MEAVSDSQNRHNYGAELRAARLAVGIRHTIELAGALHVSEQTVQRWERSQTRPQRSLRPDLADALRISLDDLDSILGTSTDRRSTRGRDARPTNVVSFPNVEEPTQASEERDSVETAVPAESAETDNRPVSHSDAARADMREDFARALIKGLETGEASDRNWTRAAQAAAGILGIGWPEAGVSDAASE